MSRLSCPSVVVALLAGAFVPAALACPDDDEFTSEFRLEDCTFASTGRNAYFSLEPGDRLVLEGDDDGEELVVEITVLPATRWVKIMPAPGEFRWVRTRVIREREWVDGELLEISKNYYARCKETDDVYYFGEMVDIYDNGRVVSHAGAWLAGVNGAKPGLAMPGSFLLGSRYFQEIAPGVALDRAEHTAMGLELDLDAGSFGGCVEVTETNGLTCDPDSDTKLYCPGVGLVTDAAAELVYYEIAGSDDDEDDDEDHD